MKLQKIREGKAVVWAYPEEVPGEVVFYNPRMTTNRDLSVLALKALSPGLKKKMVLDGFCASGIRGIRYALEARLGPVTFLDASEAAMAVCRKNVRLNKLKKAEFVQQDFDSFATSGRCFDVVELDPFGTPATFVANALRLLPKTVILSVTATDLATLCGSKNGPAARRYDARPLYVVYAPVLALRIVAGFVVRQAAMQDVAAQPMFSFYQDHFAKVLFGTRRGAQAADAALEHVGLSRIACNAAPRNRPSGKRASAAEDVRRRSAWQSDVNDSDVLAAMKAARRTSSCTPCWTWWPANPECRRTSSTCIAPAAAWRPPRWTTSWRASEKGLSGGPYSLFATAVKTDASLAQLKAVIGAKK